MENRLWAMEGLESRNVRCFNCAREFFRVLPLIKHQFPLTKKALTRDLPLGVQPRAFIFMPSSLGSMLRRKFFPFREVNARAVERNDRRF